VANITSPDGNSEGVLSDHCEVLLDRFRPVPLMCAGLILGSLLGSCGGGEPPVDLSAVALEGRSLALASGCSACHGKNGEGGVGPTWQELADSEVTFTDSTSLIADADYLTESIHEPSARLREGYTVKMPPNSLTKDEIQKVVAYIQELK
jgi:cytochrome c oxidase subunit 2